MPKLKTNRSAAKRFYKSGSGKWLRRKAYKRHILTHKSRKLKNELGHAAEVSSADVKKVKHALPYA